MKPLDLLEHFDKGAAAFGLIATYEFDPQFFENRILSKRSFGSADRLVVFMDKGRYQELVNGGIQTSGFNRRYLVAPINRAPGVFHPKLYLALGDKRADGVIGSNNCTSAGTAYNVELCSTFSFLADANTPKDEARSVLRQIYDTMKTFAVDAGALKQVIETEFFGPLEERFPWLSSKVVFPRGNFELLHSHKRPIWDDLAKRLKDRSIRKITIIAPFYDKDLGLISRMHKRWPGASISVVAQPEYATLAGEKLAKLFGKGKHRLFAASPRPGRRLHAKAFCFETTEGAFWLTGSANATRAAFDGLNTESVLWFKAKERPEDLLADSGLSIEKIDGADFVGGTEQEPKNAETPSDVLFLGSAVLRVNGQLDCDLEMPGTLKSLTLRIRNANESLPVFAIPVSRPVKGKLSIELDENQIAQIRSAAICDFRGTLENGQGVDSNPTALVQLYQILRERQTHIGERDPRKLVEETGENIVAYADGMGSVREAVEFYNNCNIRFHDGESPSGAGRHSHWKPRDPFRPDTSPNWLTISAGGTAEDLRAALLDFVARHQSQKLLRHVRRGNLNGLANFLDIFRTLNGLLVTYSGRTIGSPAPIIPFAYVTDGVMRNLELLIGSPDALEDDDFEARGFVSAIQRNMTGDLSIMRERMREERIPQMLLAATEAMIDVRMRARRMNSRDRWAMIRLRWVSDWISAQKLKQPTPEEVREAGMEYALERQAA